jgi:hypothetical protein
LVFDVTQIESGGTLEQSMDSKSQFHALEVMCRERAAVAKKEMIYWLTEAEEWAQFRKSSDQSLAAAQASHSNSEPPAK